MVNILHLSLPDKGEFIPVEFGDLLLEELNTFMETCLAEVCNNIPLAVAPPQPRDLAAEGQAPSVINIE